MLLKTIAVFVLLLLIISILTIIPLINYFINFKDILVLGDLYLFLVFFIILFFVLRLFQMFMFTFLTL